MNDEETLESLAVDTPEDARPVHRFVCDSGALGKLFKHRLLEALECFVNHVLFEVLLRLLDV